MSMNAVIDSPQRLLLADSSAIKVTVIYGDFLSGARAKNFAERLADGLGSRCPPSESMWRIDLLDCPSKAAEAARAAANCEYLIVSFRGDHILPLATRRWIEAQLDDAAGRLTCLIALLSSPVGLSRPADDNRNYLRGVCAANGVGFFSHAGTLAAPSDVADSPGEMPASGLTFSGRPRTPMPLDD